MGAMILAEVGDFSRFDSPDKLLAYAGMSPSTYQSGQLNNCYAHMEKRGSRYLRFAIYNATKYVCLWDPTFAAYLAKKRAEGKRYLSCRQEAGAAHLCDGELRASLPADSGCVTRSNTSCLGILMDACLFAPFLPSCGSLSLLSISLILGLEF